MATKTTPKGGGKRPKTVSRFAALSGANYSPDTDDVTDPDVGGVVGGLAAAEIQAAGHRIRQVDVASLLPHPFNDPKRSEPAPGDPKWDELVRSVAARGVQVPGVAVTRAAFVAARPGVRLPDGGTHVLVYGHRRRAAASAAGRKTLPLVVDDSVLENDGDLDAMAVENLGRQDLGALAEARLYARYSEDVGLSQSAIADRLGVDQATVSRRLALLLLTDEALAALEDERLSVAAAAALAGPLPFGRVRRWQKTKSSEQDSEERRADQVAALRLIVDRNTSPTRAAERVLAERAARQEAVRRGVEVVSDPRSVVGADYLDRQVDDPGSGEDVIAAIDDATGTLVFYSLAPSPERPGEPVAAPAGGVGAESAGGARRSVVVVDQDETEDVSDCGRGAVAVAGVGGEVDGSGPAKADGGGVGAGAEAEKVARTARLAAAAKAARVVPPKARLGELVVEAVVAGVDLQAASVVAQADVWATGDGGGGGGHDGFKAHAAIVWRRVLAGYEALVGAIGWSEVGQQYLDILHDRVGYVPSAWERRQIG